MKQLRRILEVLRRRWVVAAAVLVVGLGLVPVVALLAPAYKAEADILIVSEALKDTTSSDPSLPSIITSTEVLNRVIDRFGLRTDSIALAKKIKTKLPPKSSVMSVTYKDSDGRRAANVVNGVVDEAAAYYHQIAMRGYTAVIAALNARIAESKQKIAAADAQLQSASTSNAFYNSDKALDDLTNQVDSIEVTRNQLGSTLAGDRATLAALQRQLRAIEPIVHGEILQKDPVYAQLANEFGRDVADLTSERASFRATFPGLSALAGRVDRERGELTSAAATAIGRGDGLSTSYTQAVVDVGHAAAAVAADVERLRATDGQLASERQHLKDVAGAGALVGTLRAERDAELAKYLTLTQRLGMAEGDAAQAASLGSLVVVSRAVPGKSSLWLWLSAFLIVTIALATGAAYLVESVDPRLWGIREIESVYGRPVLFRVGENP